MKRESAFKKAISFFMAVLFCFSAIAMMSVTVSAKPIDPPPPSGYASVNFVGDPYFCEDAIVIHYTTTFSGSTSILLCDKSSTTIAWWSVSAGSGDRTYQLPSGSKWDAGVYQARAYKNDYWTAFDWAKVGFIELPWSLYGQTINPTSYRTAMSWNAPTPDGWGISLSCGLAIDGFRAISGPTVEVKAELQYEDRYPGNMNLWLDDMISMKLFVKKVAWNSGTSILGAPGRTYGSSTSIQNSAITMLNTANNDAGGFMCYYPNGYQGQYPIGSQAAPAFDAMKSASMLTIIYDTAMMCQSIERNVDPGSYHHSVPTGNSDLSAWAKWDFWMQYGGLNKNGYAVSFNDVQLALVGGQIDYCFEVYGEFKYYLHGSQAETTSQSPHVFICVTI